MATVGTMPRKGDWEDVANIIFGFFLVLTPWLLDYSELVVPAYNAWIAGVVIMAISLAAILKFTRWEEYLNIAVGLWLAVSPFLLGYWGEDLMTGTHVGVGILVAALAGYEIFYLADKTTDTHKMA
jgi:hypothetical protein